MCTNVEKHSTGPDNRWALLFTLYPTYSIMTQRKGSDWSKEWKELLEKCKSGTVGCEFMTVLEAYSVIPSLAAELVLVEEWLNLAVPCDPVTGGWWWRWWWGCVCGGGVPITRSQLRLSFSFFSRAEDLIGCFDGRAHTSAEHTITQLAANI